MKRTLIIAALVMTTAGCSAIRDLRGNDDAYENPFYAKYLNTGSDLDARINRTLAELRANPGSPELHNELGSLLVEKGFPKDAELEFERAVNIDGRYFPGWYNLGLVRAAAGDDLGARRAWRRTVSVKPGHSMALFQLGLIEEQRKHMDQAIDLYAKAYRINPTLLDVKVNPRVLDSRLTHLAVLKMYPAEHTKRAMQFHGVSAPTGTPLERPASPQPSAEKIVTPAPPVTDPAKQPAAKPAPPRRPAAAPGTPPATETAPPARRRPPATTTAPATSGTPGATKPAAKAPAAKPPATQPARLPNNPPPAPPVGYPGPTTTNT